MKNVRSKFTGLIRNEEGQVLPIVALMLIALLGISALTLDGGRAMYASRELQATTDSAVLAGAAAMRSSASTISSIVGANGAAYTACGAGASCAAGTAGQYSSITGAFNVRPSLPSISETATLKCLTSLEALGQPCNGTVPYNAIQVKQTTTIKLYFAGLFNHPTMTLTATSTAAARGGAPAPSNVAVIVDTTLSANTVDTDCNNLTEMQCELNGFQVLLQNLTPCATNQTACNPSGGVAVNPFDRVSLFTFPVVSTSTASLDTACTTSVPNPTVQNGYWNSLSANLGLTNFNFTMPFSPTGGTPITPYNDIPTALAYTFPVVGASSYSYTQTLYPSNPVTTQNGTYQVTGFLSDYKTSASATTLNTASSLVAAAGAVGGCGGMAPPNFDGEYGTYYAGVIYAAQSALIAQQAASPGTQNVLIIISDGNATAPQTSNGFQVLPSSGVPNPATSSGVYPSWVNECNQAVTAANYATAHGTTVYSVAYGSEPTGCSSDVSPLISPCDTMANMASAPQEFYSDWKQSGSGSTCIASQPVTALAQIFASIAADLSEARLIPNNTQ